MIHESVNSNEKLISVGCCETVTVMPMFYLIPLYWYSDRQSKNSSIGTYYKWPPLEDYGARENIKSVLPKYTRYCLVPAIKLSWTLWTT